VRWLAQLRQVTIPTLALSSIVLARPADAGERPYAFIQGSESLSQGGLELEDWFGAARPRSGTATWEWWIGPVVGITDRLEAALYGVFLQGPALDGSPGSLQLDSLLTQVSYALADRGDWPIDVRVRGEVGIPAANDETTVWAWVIASRDFGRLNLTANLAGELAIAKVDATVSPYLVYGLGASYAIVGGFRAGGELFGDQDFDGTDSFLILGPSIAYATGRLWASTSFDFGLTHDSPRQRWRIIVGLAF
jgi:hypothetical protein